jgi:formate/nitrite transporter FocA (FNT family)
VAAGEAKANLPAAKILVMGVLSGVCISIGAATLLSVGGNCPGAPRCP